MSEAQLSGVEALVTAAQGGDGAAFRALTEPHRAELRVHCYRLLGSFHDAEDAVQEVLLAAWRHIDGYQSRSSLRTWLYRIATNRCLNMLRDARRRPTTITWPNTPAAAEPSGSTGHAGSAADARTAPTVSSKSSGPSDPSGSSGGPAEAAMIADVQLPPASGVELASWLQPFPDPAGGWDDEAGPEARYTAKEGIALAFVVALQLLPPRQRAALILRDVLGFTAAETASILHTTRDAANGALKRARAGLAAAPDTARDQDRLSARAASAAEQQLLDRFVAAFEAGDVDAVVAVLTDDVRLSMPPMPFMYRGRELARQFHQAMTFRPGRRFRLIRTQANGQPAFAVYALEPGQASLHGNGIVVLTIRHSAPAGPPDPADPADGAGSTTKTPAISVMTRFDASVLTDFDLPRSLPASTLREPRSRSTAPLGI